MLQGRFSLKSHEERQGLVYRTVPWTARFEPGRAYEVSFDHQSALDGAYAWVTGYDKGTTTVETRRTPLPRQRSTARFTERVTGGCGDVWVGLRSLLPEQEGADLILDRFTVTDLGPAADAPACATLAVEPASPVLEQGAATEVRLVLTNHEDEPARDVAVTLTAPEGWTVTAAGGQGSGTVEPGGRLTATWRVTPPADTPYGSYELRATATYTAAGRTGTVTGQARVRTLPPPPRADAWAGDLEWVSADNGWGPVERDRSNGDTAAGDGGPLTIGGQVYAKGLGTHAPARVRYHLGGRCTAFTAWVGVDDVQATRGSVRFTVVADGRTVAATPVLRAADPAHELAADVTGARYADLVVDDGGDGIGNDHADWGAARFTCS